MAYECSFYCDKCGKVIYWTNMTVSHSSAVSIARDEGWQVDKKGWFCPHCRAAKKMED